MANDKRFMAQKRQKRRRKKAKQRVKEYEAGKVKFEKLPSLAKTFVSRKTRALRKAE